VNRLAQVDPGSVIITVGAGGVGKTSVAAALGLHHALSGRRVMVVTIDPARRLATALGLQALGGKPSAIDLSPLNPETEGSLEIMMLDSREVFKNMIKARVTNPEAQIAILHNRFFKRFTGAMAGTQDHAAVEQLYDLTRQDRYDLIVLDTPPSRHALEFLNAPRRLLDFLDDSVLKWIVKPATSGMAVMSFGSRYIAKILSFFAGAEMLSDLAEFMSLMADQLGDFRQRAARVDELLKGDRTAFVVVGSPERHGVEGALLFHKALKQDGYRVLATVMNRVLPPLEAPTEKADIEALLKGVVPEGDLKRRVAQRISAVAADHQTRSRIHAARLAQVRTAAPDTPLYAVTHFNRDILDLTSVATLASALVSAGDDA